MALSLEVIQKEGENTVSFAKRIVTEYMKQYGDSVGAVELMTGLQHEEWDDDMQRIAFSLQRAYNQEKAEFLELVGDTHMETSWNKLENILMGNRFEKVSSYMFNDHNGSDEFAIWARREKGFLLLAESYGTGVNRVNLHYELPVGNDDALSQMVFFQVLEGTLNGPCFDESDAHVAQYVSIDGREGLVGHIQKIEGAGISPNVPWRFYPDHFLWLCDFSEEKQKDYDSKEIRKRKLSALPDDIKEMIGYR